MRRFPASGEKPLHWVGSAKRDVLSFQRRSRTTWGTPSASLNSAEPRRRRSHGKASVRVCWRSLRRTTEARIERCTPVRFERALYVLHAFQKKSPSGIRTAKRDVDLIETRLKQAQRDYEEHHGKTAR